MLHFPEVKMEIAKQRPGEGNDEHGHGGGLNGSGFVYRLCWRNSVRNETKKINI
jgi:hypothetical protein